MSATLELTRNVETPVMEIHRGPFDVVVDGTRVGSIEDAGTVDVPIEPGRHTVQVRRGRYSSRSAGFDVSEGETVVFRCHGRRLWPILLTSLVVPSVALKLVRE